MVPFTKFLFRLGHPEPGPVIQVAWAAVWQGPHACTRRALCPHALRLKMSQPSKGVTLLRGTRCNGVHAHGGLGRLAFTRPVSRAFLSCHTKVRLRRRPAA